jgi:hypothetical protein
MCSVDEEWKSFACGILECDELQYIMYTSFTLLRVNVTEITPGNSARNLIKTIFGALV